MHNRSLPLGGDHAGNPKIPGLIAELVSLFIHLFFWRDVMESLVSKRKVDGNQKYNFQCLALYATVPEITSNLSSLHLAQHQCHAIQSGLLL